MKEAIEKLEKLHTLLACLILLADFEDIETQYRVARSEASGTDTSNGGVGRTELRDCRQLLGEALALLGSPQEEDEL